MFSKHLEVGPHVVHLLHAAPSTLPGRPPDVSRGLPVMLIHGAGSNAGVWHRQIDGFAGRHSLIAFDLPAHGRSDGVAPLATIDEMAALVLALMDRLELERAVLLGTSMGGLVALAAALRAPARVAGLVLESTAARIEISDAAILRWREVSLGRRPQPFTADGYGDGATEAMLREGWDQQTRTDPRVRVTDLEAARTCDLRARLGEIRVPTLVVHGTKDTVVAPSGGEELARGIEGARWTPLEGPGHYLYRERPDELGAAAGSFLDGVSR